MKQVLDLNKLEPQLYVEPFLGGGSVALQLLSDGLVSTGILSDRDPLIASFWHCVFYDTDWLVSAVQAVEVSVSNWAHFKDSAPRSRRDRALKCIFLNRTSFSGIIAPSGGPLGGRFQQSAYDIACRFPRATIVKRIRQAAELRDRVISVQCLDWKQAIRGALRSARRMPATATFLYLDPPFYNKADRLYAHFFTQSQHLELQHFLHHLSTPWLLSYDPAEWIVNLYSTNGSPPHRVHAIYSASSTSTTRKTQELIVTNLPRLPTVRRSPGSATNTKAQV